MALRLAGERYPSEGIFDTVTITDGAGHYLQVPKLTTAQRDALAPTNGMIIYNTTTGRFEAYDGGWDALNIANILTTKGDLFIRGASEIERLATGAKRFFPRVNEAADGLEYVKGFEWGPYLRKWQWELDFFEWTTTVTGSGAVVVKNYGSLKLQTGATAGSTARGRGYSFGWYGYGAATIEMFAQFCPRLLTANGHAWFKLDIDASGDPTDYALGWRLDQYALKGISHDGVQLHVVDLGVTCTPDVDYNLFMKFVAGSKVEWYVDGVKKGETANIPDGPRCELVYPILAVENGADESNNLVDLWCHGWVYL